jgi:hypothetical protein
MIENPKKIELHKKTKWLVGFICVLSLSMITFDLTIAPERQFKVVDEKGVPIARTQVIQCWDQFSVNYHNEERLFTGADGFVLLRRRGVKTSWFKLIIGAASQLSEYTIHASICSSESIYIDVFGYESKRFFDGEGLGDVVVLKKQ